VIEHPDWTPSELQQMHDLRALLKRKRGGVMFKTKPSRAQQFVLDEWMREYGPRTTPERQRRPDEIYIHWPGGIVSKIYVGILLMGLVFVLLAGDQLPEATPEQRRPYYDRYLEPIFGKSPWKRAEEAKEIEARRQQYAADRAAGIPLEPLAVPPVETRPTEASPTR
jgi:hypothetical protein